MIPREERGPVLNGLPTTLPDVDPEETSEVVPWVTRSISATAESHARWSEKVASDIQSDRNPGFWAPWPGATIASTSPLCPLEGPDARQGTDEVPTVVIVGSPQNDRGDPPKTGCVGRIRRDSELPVVLGRQQ